MRYKKLRAFTLIELLVVIAIIGLLATLSVIALSSARAKSRDSKRLADVKQMQTSLEMYYTETSHYPSVGEFNSGAISYYTPIVGTTTYMNIIPTAPTPNDGPCSANGNGYIYSPTADGSSYSISFCIGNPSNSLAAGPKCATPGGIVNIDCNGSSSGSSGTPTSTSPYFSRAYGTANSDVFRDGFQTSDGGYLAVGSSNNYSPIPGHVFSDRWLVKVGSDLNQQWSRAILSTNEIYSNIYAAQSAADGGYVLAGRQTISVLVGEDVNLKGTGWISKLDSTGATAWEANFGVSTSSNASTEFYGLKTTQDGNVLAIGRTTDTDPEYDVGAVHYTPTDGLIVKYDQGGAELWHRTFGILKDNEDILDAVELSDSSWMLLMNDLPQQQTFRYKNTLIKTDASGNELWRQDFGTTTDDFTNLDLATDGGYLISGRRYETANLVQASYLKLDSVGHEVWRKDLTEGNASVVNAVAANGDGTFMITFQAAYTGYNYQPVLLKIDSAGNELWRKVYGLPNEYAIYGLKKTSDGYLMIGADRSGPYGGQDGWILRTDNDGNYE